MASQRVNAAHRRESLLLAALTAYFAVNAGHSRISAVRPALPGGVGRIF